MSRNRKRDKDWRSKVPDDLNAGDWLCVRCQQNRVFAPKGVCSVCRVEDTLERQGRHE